MAPVLFLYWRPSFWLPYLNRSSKDTVSWYVKTKTRSSWTFLISQGVEVSSSYPGVRQFSAGLEAGKIGTSKSQPVTGRLFAINCTPSAHTLMFSMTKSLWLVSLRIHVLTAAQILIIWSVLLWIWTTVHGSHACTIFPYVIPLMYVGAFSSRPCLITCILERPEILSMSELNDNAELSMYSSGVLYILSTVTPPQEFVELVVDSIITTIRLSPVGHHSSKCVN